MMQAPKPLSFFLGILLATIPVMAQLQPYNITSIDTPANNTIVGGQSLDVGVETPVAIYGELGTIELLSGPKESPDSVVDVVCTNVDAWGFSCWYLFPNSLPPGPYHFRATISNNSYPPTLSDTFQVTAPTFKCATPPPWTNTSLSDPHYTSFTWDSPAAGDLYSMDNERDGGIVMSWGYRDGRNGPVANNSISSMTVEAVNFKTGQVAGSIPVNPDSGAAAGFDYKDNTMTAGAWRLRANYTSIYEGNPPGTPVSALSEEFFLTTTDNCPSGGGGSSRSSSSALGGFEMIATWPSLLLLLGSTFYLFF